MSAQDEDSDRTRASSCRSENSFRFDHKASSLLFIVLYFFIVGVIKLGANLIKKKKKTLHLIRAPSEPDSGFSFDLVPGKHV